MTGKTNSAPVRVLHLLSAWEGAGARRAVALINGYPKAIAHAALGAVQGVSGSLSGLSRGVTVSTPFGFPALTGAFSLRRLQTLARGMKGFDLIVSYGDEVLDAALAHALFGPGLGLAPLVHHAESEDFSAADGLLSRWRRMLALSRASAVIVGDENAEQRALKQWRQPQGKVHVVREGVDCAVISSHRPKPDAFPRLVKRKGELWLGALVSSGSQAIELLTAFAPLPAEWQLVLPGSFANRDAIIAEAIRLEIGHRVHLPGSVVDPWKFMGLFDGLVVAGEVERLPVMQAMAAGLAIAGPAVEPLTDLVSADNTKFLTGPGNGAALSGALIELAGDVKARSRIGTANRARAKAEFDVATTASQLASIYAAALGRTSFP